MPMQLRVLCNLYGVICMPFTIPNPSVVWITSWPMWRRLMSCWVKKSVRVAVIIKLSVLSSVWVNRVNRVLHREQGVKPWPSHVKRPNRDPPVGMKCNGPRPKESGNILNGILDLQQIVPENIFKKWYINIVLGNWDVGSQRVFFIVVFLRKLNGSGFLKFQLGANRPHHFPLCLQHS